MASITSSVTEGSWFRYSVINSFWYSISRTLPTEIYIKPVEPINFEFSEGIISQFAPKEWILEKIGVDMTKYQTPVEPTQQGLINEHLKGMKGREWQNFQRIIRKYNKGEITRDQAIQMLKSGYGLDDEAINTWLGDETYEQRFDDLSC